MDKKNIPIFPVTTIITYIMNSDFKFYLERG